VAIADMLDNKARQMQISSFFIVFLIFVCIMLAKITKIFHNGKYYFSFLLFLNLRLYVGEIIGIPLFDACWNVVI
jgi:hypothetical protein